MKFALSAEFICFSKKFRRHLENSDQRSWKHKITTLLSLFDIYLVFFNFSRLKWVRNSFWSLAFLSKWKLKFAFLRSQSSILQDLASCKFLVLKSRYLLNSVFLGKLKPCWPLFSFSIILDSIFKTCPLFVSGYYYIYVF